MRRSLSSNGARRLAIGVVGAYFLYYSLPSLRAEFGPDDLMNCYFAWVRPFTSLMLDHLLFFRPTPVYRPLGALCYKLSYLMFGFNLLPLRLVILCVLAANVFLTYVVSRRLSGSEEVGVVAALLRSYHAHTSHLLFNTGHIYEIVCYGLYFAALSIYLQARQRSSYVSGRTIGVLLCLFILAINAKEMAVSLPVMMIAYEIIYQPPRRFESREVGRWIVRQGRAGLAIGIAGALYVEGRVFGGGSLSSVEMYRVKLSVSRFLGSAAYYLDLLFYAHWFDESKVAILLVGMLTVAVAARSRVVGLLVTLFVVGLVPIAFIPPRSLESVLIPVSGVIILGAMLIVWVKERVMGMVRVGWTEGGGMIHVRQGLAAGVVLLVMVCVQPYSGVFYGVWEDKYYRDIRVLREALVRQHPRLRVGARLLFLEDPFPVERWDPVFIARLVYRDTSLTVDRVKTMARRPDEQAVAGYDLIFRYRKGQLVEVDKGRLRVQE